MTRLPIRGQYPVLFVAIGVIIVVGVCISMFGCSSKNDETITVSVSDVVKDFMYNDDSGMPLYETDNGVVVYDLDIGRKAVDTDGLATYYKDGDTGLTYILESGYPYKTYTNNKGMDAYITQIAIWRYMSEDELSSAYKNPTQETDIYRLNEYVETLVDEAKSAIEVQGDKTARIYIFDDAKQARVVGLF